MPDSLAHGVHLVERERHSRRKTAHSRARTFLAKEQPVDPQALLAKHRTYGGRAGAITGLIAGRGVADATLGALKDIKDWPRLKPITRRIPKKYRAPALLIGSLIGSQAGHAAGKWVGQRYGMRKLRRSRRPLQFPTGKKLPVVSRATSPVVEARKAPKRTFKYHVARFGTASAARWAGAGAGAAVGTATLGPGPGTLAGGLGGAVVGHVAGRKAYTPEVHAYMAKDYELTKKRQAARMAMFRQMQKRRRARAVHEQFKPPTQSIKTTKQTPVKYNPKVTVATTVPAIKNKPMTVLAAPQRKNPMGTRDTAVAKRQYASSAVRRRRAQKMTNRQGRGAAFRSSPLVADVDALDSLFEGARKLVDRHFEKQVEKAPLPVRVLQGAAGKAGSSAADFTDAIERGQNDWRTTPTREVANLIKKKHRRKMRSLKRKAAPHVGRAKRGARWTWRELNKERHLRRRVTENIFTFNLSNQHPRPGKPAAWMRTRAKKRDNTRIGNYDAKAAYPAGHKLSANPTPSVKAKKWGRGKVAALSFAIPAAVGTGEYIRRRRRKRVQESAVALEAFRKAWALRKKTANYSKENPGATGDSSPVKTVTRLEKLPKPTRRYKRMGSHLDSSIGKSDRYKGLSRREKDRIKYGVMRKQGWKPKRERKIKVAVGG